MPIDTRSPGKPLTESVKVSPPRRLAQDIEQLKAAPDAAVSASEDGRESSTSRGDGTTQQRVDVKVSSLKETSFEYTKSTQQPELVRNTRYAEKTDVLGRRTSSLDTTSSSTGLTRTVARTTDLFGTNKHTLSVGREERFEGGSETTTTRRVRDSRGNRLASSQSMRVEEAAGKRLVTTAQEDRGSELTVKTGATWQNETFRLGDSVDWKKGQNKNSTSERVRGVNSSRVESAAKGVDAVLGTAGKVFEWLPAQKEWGKELPDDPKGVTWNEGAGTTAGARTNVKGGQHLAIRGLSADGSFRREAKADLTASTTANSTGRFGQSVANAKASAEAEAQVDAKGRVNADGLNVSATAKVSASVFAESTLGLRTATLKLSDQELFAAVEGKAIASATASAEATGTVSITRRPPTVVVSGSAGASAVAKAEGTLSASAGFVSLVGNAYASAGAEAKANWEFSYVDGRVRVSAGVGTALGVGLGAGVHVEVDTKLAKDLAAGALKRVADQNKDGQVTWEDAKTLGRKITGAPAPAPVPEPAAVVQ